MSQISQNLHEASRIIREVLVNKFEKDREIFNHRIHELLFETKEWCGKTLLFNLPFHVRRNDYKTWSVYHNHDWDTCIHANWDLSPEIVATLLQIQPIDFWTLYLRLPSYKNSIAHLNAFKEFSIFLKAFTNDRFPSDAWSEYHAYAEKVFKLVDEEDVIGKLKKQKLPLLFIQKMDHGKVQINMMHILLYSKLHNLDHTDVTQLCVFIAYMMVFIESGLDADRKSSNDETMKNWNANGNWGKIVNYYLVPAEQDLFNDRNVLECWNSLIQEDAIRIYPFEFRAEKIEELRSVQNERMRASINHSRVKANASEQIIF